MGARTVAGETLRQGQTSAGYSVKYTIPRPRNEPLRRQRLVDFLYDNIDHPLQLVCAPAGYGKTTLLADFAEDTELPLCWYGVDEQDTDPRFFLQHLAEAVTSKFPSTERPVDAAAAPLAEPGAGWQRVVNHLVDWIEERVPEYFVLAIDDFHIAAQNAAAIEALDHLVARLPDNCRLIVSTREIPQLESLPKLISQRKVAGLGAVELRFTPPEIRELLTTHFDLEITVEEAHRLADESEGWITSILLTTHSLWKGLLSDVIVDRGRNTLLFEYIASEVFTQQGPEIQRFLLSTSVCDKYDVKLAETLAGPGAGDTLEVVESKKPFRDSLRRRPALVPIPPICSVTSCARS